MNKKTDLSQKIEDDEDFIYCPRLNNSIKSFVEKHPEGVDNERIGKVLLISSEEVENLFQSALKKIRNRLGLDKE